MLIVDDDNDHVFIIKRLFGKCNNLNIDVASDGKEGFQKLDANEYDIVIMDLRLPVIDGYDLIDFMRKQKMTSIIVVCSAFTEISNRFIDKVDAYFPKPINMASFKTTLNKLYELCDYEVKVAAI